MWINAMQIVDEGVKNSNQTLFLLPILDGELEWDCAAAECGRISYKNTVAVVLYSAKFPTMVFTFV